MRLSAEYLPAAEHTAVGGDWYDVLAFADGRLGVAVGDVVGAGIEAAATMGEVRSAVRATRSRRGGRPDAISRTASFFNQPGEAGMATVILGALDISAAEVTFARAGHPHPLLVSPDACGLLRFPGGPPVGSGYPSSYEETTVALPYGFTVLLYTDGLIERRGELLSEGEARLAAVADDGEISPDALVARVLAQLAPEGATSDDIALLAVQNDQPQHEALRIRVQTRLRRSSATSGGSCVAGWRRPRLPHGTSTPSSSPPTKPARMRSSTRTGPAMRASRLKPTRMAT